jgi:AcrR family transcriptional regulator
MTATPWGPAERLRERQLSPGPGYSPEQVAASQRSRLLAATVSVVAEKGYEATRVADLIEIAAVSRADFYKLFENKLQCFLAALDRIADLAGPSVLHVYEATPGPWDQRLGAVLDALASLVVGQPAIARVAWVEVYAAGDEAIARIERIDAEVERIVHDAVSEAPEHTDAPRDAIRAVIGGMRQIVHRRVREERAHVLVDLMPELLDWIRSYRAPSLILSRPTSPPAGLLPELPTAVESRERILVAVTELVAEKGYPAMSIGDVARRASVSRSTFYANFADKQEAFVETLVRARGLALTAAAPVFAAAPDWPRSVAAGLHALVALLSRDPALARLGVVGAYEGGDAALASRDAALATLQAFLDDGFQLYPAAPRVAPEAVAASVYALLSEHVRKHGSDGVYELAPLATFLALAPFMGGEAAAGVANEPVALPPAAAA